MEILMKEALMVLMLGATHYVDTGFAEPAIIYYEDDDTAHMTLPDGRAMLGQWRFADNSYHVAWNGGEEAEWRIAFTPGRLVYLDATGAERGDITRIVPGNPEGYAD